MSPLPFFRWNSSQHQHTFAKRMTAALLALPLKDSQSLVDVPQPELISHIVMLILRIWPCSLYLCSAERWVSMIVKAGFAIRIGACLDVDGGVAWTGDTVASVATFELALAKSREGGGGRVVD